MRRWSGFLVAACFLVPGLGSVGGVNPLDDDAGTGGDASDSFLVPTLLEPGTHEGRISRPHDLLDTYGFEGRQGQLLVFSPHDAPPPYLTVTLRGPDPADADPYPLLSGAHGTLSWPMEYLLDADGTWTLEFRLDGLSGVSLLAPVYTVPYAFSFHLEERPHVDRVSFDAAWALFETRFDEPVDVFVSAEVKLPVGDGPMEPRAVILADDSFTTSAGRVRSSAGMAMSSGSGTGSLVRSPLLPSVEVPVLTHVDELAGRILLTFFGRDITGHLRVGVASTEPDVPVEFAVATSAPVVWEEAHGRDGVHVWTDGNAGTADQVMVPGLSSTGPRSLPLDIGPRFIGWFDTHGAEGNATDPRGTVHDPTPGDWVTFYHPPVQGRWWLDLGATLGLADEADRVYFLGRELPYLGIAGESHHHRPS